MFHYGPLEESQWWWMMPAHGLFSLLFLVLFGWAIVALVHRYSAKGGQRSSSALDALDERYVRGDIQREEYLQKKSDLAG